MKRKLLFVSLVAALSTVGYAFDTVGGDVQSLSGKAEWNTGTIDNINKNLNSVVDATDRNFTEVQNKLNGKIDKTEADNKFVSKSELEDKNKELEDRLNLADRVDKVQSQQIINGQLEDVKQNGRLTEIEKENRNQNDRLDEVEKENRDQNDRLDDLNLDMSTVKGTIDNIDITNNEQNEKLDELETNLNNKVDQKEFDEYAGKVEGMNTEIGNINSQLDQKVDKEEFDQKTDSLKQDIDKNNHISVETDKRHDQEIADLQTENGKQNDRLDKVETENGKQNDRLDKVEDKNVEQDKAIKKEQADRIAADEKLAAQMDKFQGQMNNYGSRIDNLEKRVDNLDNKLNKGLSLMAAMNAVDFQDVAEGEMAIGAGVGHYGNAQSVAIGVAYAPTQNLNVNMKYSVTAGDVDSFAIGAGASYKFRVK